MRGKKIYSQVTDSINMYLCNCRRAQSLEKGTEERAGRDRQ